MFYIPGRIGYVVNQPGRSNAIDGVTKEMQFACLRVDSRMCGHRASEETVVVELPFCFEGDRVEFESTQGPKGPKALKVKKL